MKVYFDPNINPTLTLIPSPYPKPNFNSNPYSYSPTKSQAIKVRIIKEDQKFQVKKS